MWEAFVTTEILIYSRALYCNTLEWIRRTFVVVRAACQCHLLRCAPLNYLSVTPRLLRRSDPDDLWTGYEENNLGDGRYRVRPDFIRPKAGVIVDSKYKFFPDRNVGDHERADAYQILAYSRHREILQKLSEAKGPERPEKLVLLYPDVDYGDPSQCGSESLDDAAPADESFEIPLVRKRLYCPVLEQGVEATAQSSRGPASSSIVDR